MGAKLSKSESYMVEGSKSTQKKRLEELYSVVKKKLENSRNFMNFFGKKDFKMKFQDEHTMAHWCH